MKIKGFTLIELMVVIAIIGALSSIILSSMSLARARALDTAAFQLGLQVNALILSCDINGGKVTIPDSPTNPTNNICSLGADGGKWPDAPEGWLWTQVVWTTDKQNLIKLTPTYGNGRYDEMHCGHYPEWVGYCGGVHVGLCRGEHGFTCTVRERTTGIWR
jgi:prepilin-type N-terminal cleavage/methylation domain-containing protein